MGVVYLNAHDRPGSEVLITSQTSFEIANWDRKLVDHQITTRAHRYQCSARSNKFAKRFDAFVPDAAPILFANRFEIVAGQKVAWLLIGKNACIELLSKLARFDVGVVQRRVWKLILLEYPSSPAFVHIAGPRLIHPDARRSELHASERHHLVRRAR